MNPASVLSLSLNKNEIFRLRPNQERSVGSDRVLFYICVVYQSHVAFSLILVGVGYSFVSLCGKCSPLGKICAFENA